LGLILNVLVMPEEIIKLLLIKRGDVVFGKHRATGRNYFLENDATVPTKLIGKEVNCSVIERNESIPFESDFTTQFAVKVKRNGKIESVKANEKVLKGDIIVYSAPKRTFTVALTFEEESQLAQIELLDARRKAVDKMASCKVSTTEQLPF
jgi:hypothetical protein